MHSGSEDGIAHIHFQQEVRSNRHHDSKYNNQVHQLALQLAVFKQYNSQDTHSNGKYGYAQQRQWSWIPNHSQPWNELSKHLSPSAAWIMLQNLRLPGAGK